VELKPLYLHGADVQVSLDAPALKVCSPHSAPRWYPLRRISQVLSMRQVNWSLEALLACAEAGIGVCFQETNGRVMARCLGRVDPGRQALPIRLDAFLSRPDWASRYGDWLTAMEQMALRSLLRQAGWMATHRVCAATLRRCFQEVVRRMKAEEAWRAVGLQMRGLLTAQVTQIFLTEGVDVGRFVPDGFDPVEDFTGIVFWDFELPCAHWLEQRALKGEAEMVFSRQEVVEFFEARRTRTERLAQGLPRRLSRWLLEVQ
jgi:hypothetical protein